MSGKVCHGENPGPRPYLCKPEEKDLSDFLVEVAKAGYGKSRQQVKALAANAICEKAAKANHRKSQQKEKGPAAKPIRGQVLLNPKKELPKGGIIVS